MLENSSLKHQLISWAGIIILTLLTIRLISLGLYPLYDTTEARYGEMARLMFETQNWVTPQFDYNVPFWGKPPFQTWISAASFSLFGVNEFFARLPHFLCGLITCLIMFRFVRFLSDKNTAIFSLLVLSSSLGFIIAIGMVMTDSALLMAYTLAMTSFWLCLVNQNKHLNGHLFFAALALGMMIKGPVSVVLIVIALVIWSLWQKCFLSALKSLPWKTGLPLLLMLTLPWYIWAEIRTPGFLEYFIVGEHIQRFLVSGWDGDLYGTAHVKPRGMIWGYWVLCAFPWSFWVLKLLINQFTKKGETRKPSSQLSVNKYLICWMVSPLLLFTLAGNILPIYVLPGFSAMAIIIALNSELTKRVNIAALGTLALVSLVIALFSLGITGKSNESEILASEMEHIKVSELYYWKKRPFSAQFYSAGKAKLLNSELKLKGLIERKQNFYMVLNHEKDIEVTLYLEQSCELKKQVKNRSLYFCP